MTAPSFFSELALEQVEVADGVALRVRHGGTGPPLLLLHGHPRTHTTWHLVAERLMAKQAVVCPDLRGYGGSSKPPTDARHEPYSKRVMAADCIALMSALGHERFAVAGHDRGALVAFRSAMDHPDSVAALIVLDGLPVIEHLDRCDAGFARAWWHWWFLGQTDKPAERTINADPDAWYTAQPASMSGENLADYRRAIHDPETVHGMCEDYRAGLGIDYEHDHADRVAGRRIECPTLVGWSLQDDMEELYGDPLRIWRLWAQDVRAARIDSGRHMSEEAPDGVAAALGGFLAEVQ